MLTKVTITLDPIGEQAGRRVWFVFQTDHGSLRELTDDLTDGGLVCGIRYNVRPHPTERDARLAYDQIEQTVSGAAVHSLQPFTERMFTADGVEVLS